MTPSVPPPAPAGRGAETTTQTITTAGGQTFIGSVSLGLVRPRNATTDAQGVFEFTGLPPGTYRINANPGPYSAAYLATAYGAKTPNGGGMSDPGTPIDLTDGQVFDKATVGLIRGAVITGRVTDEGGEPLARVQISTVLLSGSRRMRVGNAQTDDLGQFRTFGLVPGDYLVAAEARGNTYAAPNAPPETEEDRIGFLTTYFPGTPDEVSAQRVRARSGGETPGVEIRMLSGRLFHLTGTVTDSQGRTSTRVSGSLMKRTPGNAVISSFGFSTDEQGRFQMRNIPPGSYRLTVRQQSPPGPRNADGSPMEPGEFASMPLSIASDLDDMLITTAPGATIMGTILFENGPPQAQANQGPMQLRVFAQAADPENAMGVNSPPPATVGPDLTFTIKGLAGEQLLRSSAPGNSLKAVLAGTEDVTDTPHEFKTGERITIVMTSRAAVLEGTITDAAGKPATDAVVLLFSDDKAFWRQTSIRTKRGGSDAAGHYKISGVLAGRYIMVALSRDRINAIGALNDPATYEALAKEGTAVVVGEDEQRQVDVRVSPGGGL